MKYLYFLNKDFVPNENIQNALNQAYTEYTKQAEAKTDYAEYDQEDEQEQNTDFDFDLD